jgi:dTDP-4-amino-4,6-dideoxygalactose transaminase
MTAQPFLPFALPDIGDDEIAEVVDTLKSGWITTGPKAKRFEQAFAEFLGDPQIECIAVNSATAGLTWRWRPSVSARAMKSSQRPTRSRPPPKWCVTSAPT